MPKGIKGFQKGNKVWLGRKHSEESKSKMKGRVFSKETRDKISKALKGWNFQKNTGRTHFKKGMTPWNKGKPHLKIRGKNNYNWKNGIYATNERIRHTFRYTLWRKNVYKRDNYSCKVCGKHCQNKEIIAHHIKSFSAFPNMRFILSNGITLCRSCHIITHQNNGEIQTLHS